MRHLQVKVQGQVLRNPAVAVPLFLIVGRGKKNTNTRRTPLPLLINALPDEAGQWALPLALATLLV